jgi:uncharacterized lipoprotein YmbA
MMYRRCRLLPRVLLSVVLLVLSGCAKTPPTRFYVLPALTGAETAALSSVVKPDLTIGVGPVTLPPYLDRPQIVTRASLTKLELGEFDQWAAPLQDTFARVLAENLSLLLGTDRVLLHPWPRTTDVNYQVTVDVIRFDGGVGGEVVLAVRWSLIGADGKELTMRKTRFQAPANPQDYEATVTAMSRILEDLSRDIAATLQTTAHQASTR